MKKLILLSLAIMLSVISYAQLKGEKYVSGTAAFSAGTTKVIVSDGMNSTESTTPSNTTFQVGGEFGYFIADNVRLGVALSIPVTSTPTSEDENGRWLRTTTFGLSLNPNIAYYMKITDRIFYTPEIGLTYEFGLYNQKLSSADRYRDGYSGWSIYLSYASFEFRATEKLAVGLNVGAMQYIPLLMIKDRETDSYIATSDFKFNLNSAAISVKMYF